MKRYIIVIVALLLLPIAFAGTQQDLWDKATAVYHFNDNTADDAKGVYDGTKIGTVVSTSGKLGNAFDFQGSSDYIDLGGSLPDNLNQIAVSAWVKIPTAVSLNYCTAYVRGNTDSYISINTNPGSGLFEEIRFRHGTLSSGGSSAPAGTYSDDGQWHHVVTEYTGSAIKIYYDGTLASTNSGVSGNINYGGASGKIGAAEGGLNWFNGDIDEFIIFEEAIGQTGVDWLYNSGAGRELEPEPGVPNVNITFPVNGSVYAFDANLTIMNFSISETAPTTCWYSIDGGQTNISTSCSSNITGITQPSPGNHTWTFYANSTAGLGSSNVSFVVNPQFKTRLFELRNKEGYNVTWMDVVGNFFTNGTATINGFLQLNQGEAVDEISNDDTLADNSNISLVTEYAIKAYVDNSLNNFDNVNYSLINDSIDSKISDYNITITNYINNQDEAYNDSMKLYVDTRDTYFNTSMATYVDNQDEAFNTSIATYVDNQDEAYNTSIATYVDNQDEAFNTSIATYVDNQDEAFNTSIATYVDNQDTAFNNSMKLYVDTRNTYFNTSIANYVDNQDEAYNTSIANYVDNQDEAYNDSMKIYVDSQIGDAVQWNVSNDRLVPINQTIDVEINETLVVNGDIATDKGTTVGFWRGDTFVLKAQ